MAVVKPVLHFRLAAPGLRQGDVVGRRTVGSEGRFHCVRVTGHESLLQEATRFALRNATENGDAAYKDK